MNWLALLGKLLQLMSPELRKLLVDAVEQWEVTAKDTKTPVDDLVVMLLHIVLGM